MSLMLRAFQANGVGYEEGMRWMGLDRRQAIGEGEVAALAWALHTDFEEIRSRIALLEGRSAGRWVQLAGQRLSRWIAPTTMLAKLCPACLRETGYARVEWLIRAVPACEKHGYSVIRDCAHCGRPIRWARPGVRICQCGRFFKQSADPIPIEPELGAWLKWTAAVMAGSVSSACAATKDLPVLLHGMTIDGAFRLIEVFGLKDAPGTPVRGLRHSSASMVDVGKMLVRGIQRLACVGQPNDACRMDFELAHLPVLHELADAPASDADGLRAAWLLDVHRYNSLAGPARVGTRPRRQLPLFL